jgi:long-chain acyl-CoA synthetase
MLDSGLLPGDRILLFMRNHPRYLEILFGAWWAGVAVVPVNAKLHTLEAEWIIQNSGARWGFVTSDVAPTMLAGLERQIDIESAEADALLTPQTDRISQPLAERGKDSLAWLFYTSGTTGRPKGVMIT